RDLLADTSETAPGSLRLHLSAFPQPVTTAGTASLRLELSTSEHIRLDVFDAGGRKVATLVDESMEAGTHLLPWAPRTLHPGVYFGRAEAGTQQASTKIVVVR
ncbi:MAG: T9SS type A sorting domain-containing protein, partial [Candidatus Eisenbacteria bacterium]|nr:T9SS type A sorting domain-containing protein [Candidatus Eisenbacteria bacterium]